MQATKAKHFKIKMFLGASGTERASSCQRYRTTCFASKLLQSNITLPPLALVSENHSYEL